ncbi:MAG: hypothetical protein ACK56I_19485, partial [bacterium]
SNDLERLAHRDTPAGHALRHVRLQAQHLQSSGPIWGYSCWPRSRRMPRTTGIRRKVTVSDPFPPRKQKLCPPREIRHPPN